MRWNGFSFPVFYLHEIWALPKLLYASGGVRTIHFSYPDKSDLWRNKVPEGVPTLAKPLNVPASSDSFPACNMLTISPSLLFR